MNSIIDSQREILLSVQGTNIWSGQQLQSYNSQAIAWGGLAHELFSSGQRYQWVPLSYLIGLVAPLPFWIVHCYWPRLRMDYYYIPIIWYALNSLMIDIQTPLLTQLLHRSAFCRNKLFSCVVLHGLVLVSVVAPY
jgi:hypothetical protein